MRESNQALQSVHPTHTRILAQELCNRVKENRRVKVTSKAVGYAIAREALKDASTKILYCTEAVVALMMQSYLHGATSVHKQEDLTTVIIDEAHNRSSQSDYVP